MDAVRAETLREIVDGVEPPHPLVAEPARDRDVALEEVDDDPLAQRPLAHHNFVAPEHLERPDDDRVSCHDDVGAARVHAGDLAALGRRHAHHRALQRFQPVQFQDVAVHALGGEARIGGVDRREAHERPRGADHLSNR